MKKIFFILFVLYTVVFSCAEKNDLLIENIDTEEETTTDENEEEDEEEILITKTFNLLSLGDSYTIGQSVCNSCRFPNQLKDSLQNYFGSEYTINLQIIAQTGWTTDNLKNSINIQNPDTNKDLVTLLIGVNNQYRNVPFSVYEQQFGELVQTAKRLAKGNLQNVIVISIPDYAYTPFGQNSADPSKISSELDAYNTFAKNYCSYNNISFINITDITRMGLDNTDLVALDKLHPSELAYSKFVARILPTAIQKIK